MQPKVVLYLLFHYTVAWDAPSWNESSHCLDNAIAESDRINISYLGESSAIRIMRLTWILSKIDSEIARIVLEERAGFKVEYSSLFGGGSWASVRATAGCSPVLEKSVACFRDGKPTHPEAHMVFDAWRSYIPGNYKQTLGLDDTIYPNLVDFSYKGEDGLCFRPDLHERALQTLGIDLTYYRFYNANWFDASVFFNTTDDVDRVMLESAKELGIATAVNRTGLPLACDSDSNNVVLYQGPNAETYLKETGDSDGVENRSDGVLIAKCDGGWWRSPTCRKKKTKCIPFVTVDSWLAHAAMQWATFYEMPIAVGSVLKTETRLLQEVVNKTQILFYETLHNVKYSGLSVVPSKIVFPTNVPHETSSGIFRTANSGALIVKATWKMLGEASTGAAHFASHFDLTQDEVGSIGLKALDLGPRKAACEFLRDNEARWKSWIPPSPITCKAGQGFSQGKCEDCQPGFFSPVDGVGTKCYPCAIGTYAPNTGAKSCIECPPGSQQDLTGQPKCNLCLPGRAARKARSSECVDCEPGYAQAVPGQAACDRCKAGKYQNTSRSVQCNNCTPPFTTRFLSATQSEDCQCQPTTVLSRGGYGCDVCGEGLSCPDWGMYAPLAARGYMMVTYPIKGAASTTPVFYCYGNSKRCPGGPAGTCASGRDVESFGCFDCVVGKTSEKDGTCSPCSDHNSSLIMSLVIVAAVIGVIVMYAMGARDTQTQLNFHVLFFMIVGGLVVGLVQTLGVLNMLEVDWGEPISSLLSIASIFKLDIELLQLDCMLRASAVQRLLMKCLILPVGIAIVLICHALNFVIRRDRRTKPLVNSLGGLNSLLYISYFATVLAAFQCDPHPSGLWTLRSYRTVLCWNDGGHNAMIGISIAFLIFPLTFLIVVMSVVWQLPGRMANGDANFLRTWMFVFCRFEAKAYWYPLCLLGRSTSITIMPLLPGPISQIFCMQFAQYIFFGILCITFPWRDYHANILDILVSVCTISVLGLAPFFVEDPNKESAGVLAFSFGLGTIVLLITMVLARGVMMFARRGQKEFDFLLCHHKQGAASFTRLLKMKLVARKCLRGKVFFDSDDLQDLAKLFGYIGQHSNHILAVCSPELCKRPWCMGELTTARIHNVPVTLLKQSTFAFPDDDLINNYSTYVPDVSKLAVHGVSLEMVQETLRWLPSLHSYEVPSMVTLDSINQLTHDILKGTFRNASTEWFSQASSIGANPAECETIIIGNTKDPEATSTAIIVRELVLPLMQHKGKNIHVLQKDESLPKSTKNIIMICTSGCFEEPFVMKTLLEAAEFGCGCLPVLSEDNFRFPAEAFFARLSSGWDAMQPQLGTTHSARVATKVLRDVFREIAVVVQPQDYSTNEEVLAVRSQAIAQRLENNLSRLSIGVDDNYPTASAGDGETGGAMVLRGVNDIHYYL